MYEKIMLVTGASSGIGQAIAIELSKANNYIYVNYNNNEEGAIETLNKIKEKGGNGKIIHADVSNTKDVDNMFLDIKCEYGHLDVLVNNSGIISDAYFFMMSKKSFDYVMNVNVGGCFYCSQNAAKLMISSKRGGNILNISSTSGISGQIGQANYSASKGAIISLTKTLAKELAKDNIRVNSIAPGFIRTKMTKKNEELFKKKYLEFIPLKRFGEPEEISKVASFLVSDESSYITGQTIVVDGGLTI